jgi:hypothetical protein
MCRLRGWAVTVDRLARDVDWNAREADGSITWERAGIAVLMDIRRELRDLNRRLLGVGPTVHQIEQNTRPLRCHLCGRGPYLRPRGFAQHLRRMHTTGAAA